MMKKLRFITLFVPLSTLLLPKTQMTLYISVPSAIITEIKKAFEKVYLGINVVAWRSGTSKVTAKILPR
ncbi:MAG: hypothetical protein DRP38_01660 [Thermotogae bacterium]|nr:MAG: hypothetical protein DRP38_01660 [Thermotogota bacterium]